MFDERTPNLDIPIPNVSNPLNYDVSRLRDAFNLIDKILHDRDESVGKPDGLATLDSNGKVTTSQLPADEWALLTGSVLDFALPQAPSGWRLCSGKPLLPDDTEAEKLRTALLAAGNPYGADSNGNPRLPDARGRGIIGKDDMGGTLANRVTTAGSGIDGKTLGATGGTESVTLTTEQIPTHGHAISDPGHNHGVTDPTHAHSIADPGHAHGVWDPGHAHGYTDSTGGSGSGWPGTGSAPPIARGTAAAVTGIGIYGAGTGIGIYGAATGISIQSKLTGITLASTGGGQSHNNMQPTLVMNKIIKL